MSGAIGLVGTLVWWACVIGAFFVVKDTPAALREVGISADVLRRAGL